VSLVLLAAASSLLIQSIAAADPAVASARLSRPCTTVAGSARSGSPAGPYAAITSAHRAGSTDEVSIHARSATPGMADTSLGLAQACGEVVFLGAADRAVGVAAGEQHQCVRGEASATDAGSGAVLGCGR